MGPDLQNQTILTYLPIAHASPVCAFRVRRALETLDYDTLFVELPCEAQGLLPALTHRDTRPPVSLLLRAKEGEYILPLEAFAPEYVAARIAAAQGKRVVFIDSVRFFEAGPKSCPPAAAWIESTVDMADADDFFARLEALAAPFSGPPDDRERGMAARIAAIGPCRGAVVAGAKHCAALKSLTGGTPEEAVPCDSYLIPYIPPQLARGDYTFRRLLYERLGADDPFFDTALEVLLRLMGRVHRDYPFERIPLTDVIHTLTHAKLLASLRGKRGIGAAELRESAMSVIAKADDRSVKRAALDELMDEMPEGKLAQGFATPLVEDFHRKLEALKIRAEAGSRITLNILSDPDHRQKSRFLHQLEILGAEYAVMLSGARYAEGQGRNLVREVWRVKSAALADTKLTYCSHLGATVAEAAQRVLDDSLEETLLSDAPGLCACYNRAYFVGLDSRRAFDKLSESVYHIGDIGAAAETLSSLAYLIEVKYVFEGARAAGDLAVAGSLYARAVAMLPAVLAADPGEKEAAALSTLHDLAVSSPYLDAAALLAPLRAAPSFIAPCLYGCAQAILAKDQTSGLSQRLETILHSQSQPSDVGMLVLGLALGDRGLMTQPAFVRAVAGFVESLSLEEFLEAAPALRYAFSLLKQTERRAVRLEVGQLFGEEAPPLVVDPALLLKDEYLARQIDLYGLKEKRA